MVGTFSVPQLLLIAERKLIPAWGGQMLSVGRRA
jgi:hypothetical protein